MTKPLPSEPKQRVEVIDALRGFALVGILLANIVNFSGVKYMPLSEIKQWQNLDIDLIFYKFNGIFVDTKFYTIFSLLFGIGFFLQFDKNRDNQSSFMKMYYRRLFFLMLFGLIHMFFWSGDILFIYGLVGFAFVQFRNTKLKNLLIIAGISFIMPLITSVFMMIVSPGYMVPEVRLALHTYTDILPEQIVAIFKNGSFWEITKMNWHNTLWRYFELMPEGRLFKVFTYFILGYYLMASNYFEKKATSIKLLLVYLAVGFGLTFLAKQVTGNMRQFPSQWSDVLYRVLFNFGQVNVAFAYISILTIIYKKAVVQKLLSGLKYVGRMSFSSYLGQTIICVIIFYSYGFGLYSSMTLWQVEVIAVGVYLLQIVFAVIWLKYFTFGPLEWLWRSLTYGKILPLRKIK